MDRVKLVEGLRKAHDDLDGAFDALRQLAGSAPESLLWMASWGAFDSLVQAVAMAIGDFEGWVEWWVWENDFGRKGLMAGFGEDMRPIESVEDLLWLVERSPFPPNVRNQRLCAPDESAVESNNKA